MIKLSVITINRNDVRGLEKTIKSVLSQTSQDFEYIIIDGASTDGSKELIERLAIDDNRLSYWCSEPDSGIYNAMNKGIRQAQGEYCLFLNAGDSLVDDNVISDFIKTNYNQDFICGNIHHVDDDKKIRTIRVPEKINLKYLWWQSIPHQSSFIKRALFENLGYYNEELKFFADWEFVLKTVVINNCSYVHYNRDIADFDINGVSSCKEENLVELKEKEREQMFNSLMPVIYNSFKQLLFEMEDKERKLRECQNMYNGKLGVIIKAFQFIKTKVKHVS